MHVFGESEKLRQSRASESNKKPYAFRQKKLLPWAKPVVGVVAYSN